MGFYLKRCLLAFPVLSIPVLTLGIIIFFQYAYFIRSGNGARLGEDTLSGMSRDESAQSIMLSGAIVISFILLIAVYQITAAYINTARLAYGENPQRMRWAWRRIAAMLVVQVLATGSMIVSIHYSLADWHVMHMAGSYGFFGLQTASILATGWYGLTFAKAAGPGHANRVRLHVKSSRLRWRWAVAAVCAAISYLVLFIVKDAELGGFHRVIRVVYTSMEILLILGFTGYLGLFASDVSRSGGPD